MEHTIKRTTLGLELCFSVKELEAHPGPNQLLFSDDTFKCSTSDLVELVEHIKKNRPDLMGRVLSKKPVLLLLPQADPLVMRVSAKPGHGAYFNLGELWRWRFLKHLPDYPFKDYQSIGTKWLCQRSTGVLADEMGLGKTLQAIAAMEIMHRLGKINNTLIVCPKSLIGVWEAEISLWAPRLCTVALHTSISPKEWKIISTQCHVAITNYEAIRRDHPSSKAFDLVIYDEVHKLKNPTSLNYKAAYSLQPAFTWGLSGTPLENEPSDLSAILHLIDRKRVSLSDRKLPTALLRSLASQYILRRNRQVIDKELPEVIERTELIPLTLEQRHLYNKILRDRTCTNMGEWIAKFNRLRDVCDLEPSSGKSSKIDRAEVIIDAIHKLGEKVIVFSWRIKPLRLLYERLSERYGPNSADVITGQTRSISRSKLVESFQSDTLPFALLCSTRATAEGLTLTAANHVIFLNEWWNPAVNAQARDRVYRIGQTRDVYVYRLRAQGTVEDRLDIILKTKAELFDRIVNRISNDSASKTAMVPAEFARLLVGDDVEAV